MAIIWSPRANANYRKQVQWLEENRDARTVLRYLREIATAIDRISSPDAVQYQAVADHPNTYCYRLNKFTALYYRISGENVEIITFFDTRQHPDSLKLP
ncbi:type II toxin-antitoxin system RelE/ParE family toxin [Hymenobacter sp. BT664]|uniref:Type II toxin-antitoxin system RelE/ParE family toxin n=1 Tax=Hymenobacter montanus TaxID=2771359 RepID=A0A927GJV4_9BACT|nr:type II toxin-antitoxin system RelE/ParE family toxin [Hymenobacter montanus]MBD2768534.1 type II toxin-antitoxin system RelE/ParE family toxin [Hymenobacter montanus]